MTQPAVRLHVLVAGQMTSALGGFLEGEAGDLTYPVHSYVIEHPRGLAVIDAGLHPELAHTTTRLGPLDGAFRIHLPDDGSGTVGPRLAQAGFDPDQVSLVVLTHLHFDHTGGLNELPNARIVVQSAEWALRHDEQLVARGAYHPADTELGHEVMEVAGDHDLFGDGSVVCLLTDGHTAGHQSVRVRAEEATYVVCGDCCYLRRTLEHGHLPPSGHDRSRQKAALERMAAEQAAGATLLFGHDPDQWARIAREGLHPGV